jgi:DNA repair exonuclease SbcCD nuclease subunit
MRFKVMHAADLHLDSPLRGLERYAGAPAERIRGATRRAFQELVNVCLEEEVRVLLLAGDLFDGDWQDYSSGLFFVRELARLREGGVRVLWIRGNHDAASRIRKRLSFPDNVSELGVRRPETVEIEELNLAVHGQGYASADLRDDLAIRYPRPIPGALNIGLLHTALTGRPGHEPYAPCRVEALVDHGYDYWALGHVHQREVVARSPWIVFPGNLQGRHARETGPKGATLISVEDCRIVDVESRALDVVRWDVLEVDISRARGVSDALDLVRARLEPALKSAEGRLLSARLRLVGSTEAHAALSRDRQHFVEEVRALLVDVAGDDAWLERVELATLPLVDLAALRSRDDPVGQLAAAFSRLRDDPDGLALLSSELDELRAKLPHELTEGPDPLELGASTVRALLDDVERLLLSRLGSAAAEDAT